MAEQERGGIQLWVDLQRPYRELWSLHPFRRRAPEEREGDIPMKLKIGRWYYSPYVSHRIYVISKDAGNYDYIEIMDNNEFVHDGILELPGWYLYNKLPQEEQKMAIRACFN
jgi:hypothetical protein